jgi:tripartite-type tricarboxylate transporter receptor subunit TctC
MKRRVFVKTLAACLGSFGAIARAQTDERPLRLLVPFAAGGPSDQIARSVGQAMAPGLARPVIVENRPGADGIIAARAALAASRDGLTMLYVPSSLVGIGQLAKPAMDLATEFTAIGGIGHLAFGMFVTSQLPVGSVAEFIQLARSRPGQLNFATSTGSELMAAHQFMRSTGVTLARVPYKGAAQAMPDLLVGRVEVLFGPLAAGVPHAREGKLKLLATLLPRRSPLAPETPTMAEAGYPAVRVPTWQALFAPGRQDAQLLKSQAQVCSAALSQPSLRSELESRALIVDALGPEEMQALAGSDRALWAQLIREYQLETT